MKLNSLLAAIVIAAHTLANVRAEEPTGVADLVEKLKSGVTETARSKAAQALGEKGESAATAVPALVQALANDADGAVRHNAAWALGKIKTPVVEIVPALIAALEDRDWTVRHNSVLSLSWIGKDAVAQLQSAISAESPVKRVYALSALAAINPDGAALHASVLIDLVRNTSPGVRGLAAGVVGTLGPRLPEAVPPLVALLKDEDASVRGRAVEALGKIGKPAQSAVPAVIEVLKTDKERPNKTAAAVTLGEIGLEDPVAITALVAALGDKESRIRAYSTASLGRIGSPAVSQLDECLRSEDPRVRMHAAMALGGMAGAAKPAVASLVARLQDAEINVRINAAAALGAIGDGSTAVKSALEKARDREAQDPVFKAYMEQALSMLK